MFYVYIDVCFEGLDKIAISKGLSLRTLNEKSFIHIFVVIIG